MQMIKAKHELKNEDDIKLFIEAIKDENVEICQRIFDVGESMANIFENSSNEELKKTIAEIFNYYECEFYTINDGERINVVVDLLNIPNKIGFKIIELSKKINKDISVKLKQKINDEKAKFKLDTKKFLLKLEEISKSKIR